MKTFKVYFEEAFDVIIEAENEEEAKEKLMKGEYSDKPNYREITGVDAIEWTNN